MQFNPLNKKYYVFYFGCKMGDGGVDGPSYVLFHLCHSLGLNLSILILLPQWFYRNLKIILLIVTFAWLTSLGSDLNQITHTLYTTLITPTLFTICYSGESSSKQGDDNKFSSNFWSFQSNFWTTFTYSIPWSWKSMDINDLVHYLNSMN